MIKRNFIKKFVENYAKEKQAEKINFRSHTGVVNSD